MRVLDPRVVEVMARHLSSRNPAHVMSTLGISINSWTKIEDGHPIRVSVADRIEERFRQGLCVYEGLSQRVD